MNETPKHHSNATIIAKIMQYAQKTKASGTKKIDFFRNRVFCSRARNAHNEAIEEKTKVSKDVEYKRSLDAAKQSQGFHPHETTSP